MRSSSPTSTFNILTKNSTSGLLTDVSGSGFTSGEGRDREDFLEAQKIIEQNLNEALEKGSIAEAVAIIHTEQVSTPLRDAKHFRAKILERFLELGGRLVAVYKAEPTSAEELKRFSGLCKSYPNLINNYRPDSSNECSGASYLVRGKDGQIVFFSIEAAQAGARSIPMSLSLSPLVLAEHKVIMEKEAAQTQFNRIGGFLESLGVSISEELRRSSELIGSRKTTSGSAAGASAAPLSTERSSPLLRE